MRQPHIICGLLIVTLIWHERSTGSQTDVVNQSAERFGLTVSVDEVSLTFHAADNHGLPIPDLKLAELDILDNGKPPRRVLDFQPLPDFPVRAGILLGTSDSISAANLLGGDTKRGPAR